MAEETGTESQGTETKGEAGAEKFDAQAILEENKRLKRETSDLSERLDRTERMLSLIQGDQSGTPKEDYVSKEDNSQSDDSDQKSLEERIAARVLKTVGQVFDHVEKEKTKMEKFYSSNPDLQDHKMLIQAIAQELRGDPSMRRLSDEDAMKEVAKRARGEIERIRKGSGGPLRVEHGSSGERYTAPSKKEEKMPDQDEILAADIKERRALRQKHFGVKEASK